MTTGELSARLTSLGRPIIPSAIQKIEVGNRRVDVDDLCTIATALDVPAPILMETASCDTCHGSPPPGFTCNSCRAENTRKSE